jgi:hypothetical protein
MPREARSSSWGPIPHRRREINWKRARRFISVRTTTVVVVSRPLDSEPVYRIDRGAGPVMILTEEESMGTVSMVVRHLKRELERAQKEVRSLSAALAALGSSASNGGRVLSPAARKKISLAQKARWARQKATPRRTMSAAGRRRIAAAQRARWAKVKAQQKKAA